MFNDILFIAAMFITRIALPIFVTLLIGALLDRALRRNAHSAG